MGNKMPKEIKDLKEFIEIMRKGKTHMPTSEKITIKKSKKSNITKFKLRTPRYLLTLKVRTGTRHKGSWIPSHQTSRKRPRNEHLPESLTRGLIDELTAI